MAYRAEKRKNFFAENIFYKLTNQNCLSFKILAGLFLRRLFSANGWLV